MREQRRKGMCLFFQAISFALQTKSSVSHSKFQGKLMADETQEEYQKQEGKGLITHPFASLCYFVMLLRLFHFTWILPLQLLCKPVRARFFSLLSLSCTLSICRGLSMGQAVACMIYLRCIPRSFCAPIGLILCLPIYASSIGVIPTY